MSKTLLVIGNKNYSSWSLRAWIIMRKAGVEFEERRIPLDTPQFEDEIADFSPTRRVPVLWDEALCIWDSLAICEYVNERWGGGKLLPSDRADRARARSICAEMHAGFPALREQMPMNCRASDRCVAVEGALQEDINRVMSLWRECLENASGTGPWLFGEFSIADAMYIPVALRFATYSVELPDLLRSYVETVQRDSDVSEWVASASQESEVVEADEAGA
jgi:glutathione S-transferase